MTLLKYFSHIILRIAKSIVFWLALDAAYIFTLNILKIHPCLSIDFFVVHISAIIIASMVMFTGIGAGALWIPVLTFLHIHPADAVSISIFTQFAGKGIGSFNYLRAKMVDLSIVKSIIPYALLGTLTGYLAAFGITLKFERLLFYIFVCVLLYLLANMLRSLNDNEVINAAPIDDNLLRRSHKIAFISSFFTGLLSIGNSDWLIPYMQRYLRVPTSKSVATGLFIMFIVSAFYLLLSIISVSIGISHWPEHASLLYSTCSGVILGGQIGTRLIRFQWLKKHQKHAFIIMLSLSIIHMLW